MKSMPVVLEISHTLNQEQLNAISHQGLLLEDCFELYKDTFGIIVETEKRTFNRLSKEYTLEFLHEAIYKTTLRTKSNGTIGILKGLVLEKCLVESFKLIEIVLLSFF